ncbi:hypothetical protein F511_36109 [Dorcoceras hygrometricum]|uniref:Uncharacterized protein n=1 Tax=Dorcoceras hygrometricum TaxID=472368 RepID=A0A2Z7D435_9LAMI|nr:hypothetical protein F511_36109 [Dorcoceras hygrometricum]
MDRGQFKFDRWVRDRRAPISQKWELLPQRIFVDTIAPICLFIEPVQVVCSPPIVKTWGWARVCTDIVQFHLFGHLEPVGTHNICTELVTVGPVVDRSGIPRRTVNNVRYCIRIVDSISVPSLDTVAAESLGTSQRHPDADSDSSTSIPIDFVNEETADAQTSMPTAIVSSNDYTNAFAQLKDSLIEKAGLVATEYYTNDIELRLLVVRLSSISRETFLIPRRTVDTLYLLIEEAGFEAEEGTSGEQPRVARESLTKVLARTETSTYDEESMSIDDLLSQIPDNMMLPSVTAAEPTRIKFGLGIEIKGVKEGDWYKASHPQIAISDKGKAPLVESDEMKGHPAQEMFTLICVDIEFLVQIREQVIEEIVSFFSSFSLRRLAVLGSVSNIVAKEEQILSGQRQIPCRQLFRGDYAHSVALEKLKEQMRQHKLEWIRPYSSRLFEGANIDRGAVIARSNTNIRSTCWIRIFVDTFAPICLFIDPVQVVCSPPIVKTWGWARVCTDIVQFHLFGHLEPVGTHNICTELVTVGPVVDRSGIPRRTVNNVQYCIRIVDSISVPSLDTVAAESLGTSQRHPDADSDSSTSIPIDFVNEETADAQTSMPTAIVSSNDYTNAFAQLKDSLPPVDMLTSSLLIPALLNSRNVDVMVADSRFLPISNADITVADHSFLQ